MEFAPNKISQKDYLKKYLSKDKGEKKKKKKKKLTISSSSHIKRSVIIDDDLGLPSIASIDDEEFNLEYLGDEAPQIAGVVDERPAEVRAKESYGDQNKWKPVQTGENDFIKNLVGKLGSQKETVLNNGENNASKASKNESKSKNIDRNSDSDLSPPRIKAEFDNSDLNPSRKVHSKRGRSSSNDSDVSQRRSRNKRTENLSPSRDKINRRKTERRDKTNEGSSDSSPPRRKDNYSSKEKVSNKRSENKENSDSDLSPPRRDEETYKFKKNPSYKYRRGSSKSPPRSKDQKSNYEKINKSSRNKGSDYDLSPPRTNSARFHDKEKITRSRKQYKDSDSDLSPPRINSKSYHGKEKNRKNDRNSKRGSDSDLSPPRRNHANLKRKENFSKNLKKGSEDSSSDLSPPRKHNKEKNDSDRRAMKLDKTLDGKKAGLQNAKNLKDELKQLREREDAVFLKMQASVSGQNAAPVMRDRKTGKIRDLEKEKEENVEKSAKSLEREKKYAKWGKGLKQIEDAEQRLAEVLHEMNKPLARYAGDNDLEKILKEREREGDPMLDYIKSKQAESIRLDTTGKPQYQGHFMPNRFGIRPGHRWDGVDRSNGYEQKWFERQNARKAVQEEAYKWSTSDM